VAWQRKTPFGYMVADGKITVNDAEAEAVRDIFRRYADGEGYQAIADGMSESGVCYHIGKPEWNKHMIKRVLENAKYVGETGYPAIVTAAELERVQMLQASKTANYREQSDAEKLIRSRLRNLGNVRLRDTGSELEQRVTALLNGLIVNPELLSGESTEMPDIPSPNAETLRLQNELNRELTKQGFDADCAVALVFALAAEKYAALPDVTLMSELAALRAELENREPLTSFDAELFAKAVKAVTVGADGEIALTIIGGAEISENTMGEQAYGLQFA
jgi:hypothetical protein